MARFTVRVELRNPQDADAYATLDRAMKAQGFGRLIQTRNGKQYDLPTAEYRIVGRHTRAHVCHRAKAGVVEAATEAAILVTEGSCSWHNLRRPSK